MGIPNKGLYQDIRPQAQPENTFQFGKNGIVNNVQQTIENELGHTLEATIIPGKAIGVLSTDTNPVIFSTDGTYSYIGFFDKATKVYIPVVNDTHITNTTKRFKFPINGYITGETQRNARGELIAAWTAKENETVVNPFRLLNLDKPENITQASDLDFFLKALNPNLETTVVSGGVLAKGAYFVSLKYIRNDGSESSYVITSKVNFISEDNGSDTTTKALQITVDSMDQSFDKIQLAIISRVNGLYTAVELQPNEIGDGPITVVYTGENIAQPIQLEEILVSPPVYETVGTLGQLNDALYITDLTTAPQINMQRWANMIKVRVKSEPYDVLSLPEDVRSGKTRFLMHQEVYALYIRYHKINGGGWTQSFHIPGTAPILTDLDPATYVHEQNLQVNGHVPFKYQVRDTCRNVDLTTRTCDPGVWINENETYPSEDAYNSLDIGGEDLRGQQVRHHRMPSLSFCRDTWYSTNADYGKRILDGLSLEVSGVIIPPEYEKLIDGWEITIAKRTLSNSTVVGQSILLLASQGNDSRTAETNFISTGGNWAAHQVLKRETTKGDYSFAAAVLPTGRYFNDLTMGNTNQWNPNSPDRPTLRWRLHPFDLIFNRPQVSIQYLSPQYKLSVSKLNEAYPVGGWLEDGCASGDVRTMVGVLTDYTGINSKVTPISDSMKLRVVDNVRYLPNNLNTGEWNNVALESAYVGKIKWFGPDTAAADNGLPMVIDRLTSNVEKWQRQRQAVAMEDTYLVNMMSLRPDLYSTFYTQTLAGSGQFISKGTLVSQVHCGDSFICDYTFHTYGYQQSTNQTTKEKEDPNFLGTKVVRRIVCESVSNINMRYELLGNNQSKWWPRSVVQHQPPEPFVQYLYFLDRTKDPNQFGYSKDLNTLNDFGDYTPFNPYADDITNFPHRIHRTGALPRQGKSRSWRTILPLDYYEAQKNMGRIVRLLGKDDRLIIHHENAMFVTQDKAKLDTGNLSITLGSGDIFQFEPQEALSSVHGYAGTRHELAAIDTPLGYVFVDAPQGQIFIYKNGLKLMNNGLNTFFREYLKVLDINPFNGNGITIGFDPVYNRIMLTVKNKKLSTSITSFKPDYSETAEFFATLLPGDVVFRLGRYQVFLGVNTTGYACIQNLPPVATNATVTVEETRSPGYLVHTTSIVDPEGSGITFSIVGGNINNTFTVDPITGKITLLKKVNFSVMPSYVLSVRGTDDKGQSAIALITVNVVAVNEPPITQDALFTIPESLPIGSNVGQVIATDPEGLAVSFALTTPDVPFTINTATGMITTTGTLDAETRKIYDLQVTATDPAGNVSTCLVRILVTNVNEAPFGDPGVITLVKAELIANQTVHTLEVEDPDGDPVTVQLNNFSNKFTFDPATLEIKVIDPALLVEGASYELIFTATDIHEASVTFSVFFNVYTATINFEPGTFSCSVPYCEAGYTLSPDGTTCQKVETLAATPPIGGTPLSTIGKQYHTYSEYGTLIYNPGYGVGGDGTFTLVQNAFWQNQPKNLTEGPLNRNGLWADDGTPGDSIDAPINEWIGFVQRIDAPATKTYYIGIAGDNLCRLKVNGVTVVSFNEISMNSSISAYFGTPFDSTLTFKFWHIFPVTLNAGPNFLELEGYNGGSVGSFGAEIYDNTAAELAAATNYGSINLLWSTAPLRGTTLQSGGTVGYSCPAGWALAEPTPGVFVCNLVSAVAPTDSFTKTINNVVVKDALGNVITTLPNTSGQTFMGQAVPYYPPVTNSPDCGFI